MEAGFLIHSHSHLIGTSISSPDHNAPELIGVIIDQANKPQKQISPCTLGSWELHYWHLPTVLWVHYWFALAGGPPDKLLHAIK